MQHQTWTITEISDGERTEITSGASHEEALIAIRTAMYGDAESLLAPGRDPVHDGALAA